MNHHSDEWWGKRIVLSAVLVLAFSVAGLIISLHFDHNDQAALRRPYHLETTTVSVVPQNKDSTTGDWAALTEDSIILHSDTSKSPFYVGNKVGVYCAGSNCRQFLPSGSSSWTTATSGILIALGVFGVIIGLVAWIG